MKMRHKKAFLLILLAWGLEGRAADVIDEMGLEELTKADITSVSRKSQSLSDVPAAAFVISSEDIRRSGAQALPDVLRMVPGVEVAQIDSGRYAVSARGFNGRFANKLQVLVDGRSIYHPIFSGVMWEADLIALEDIERVEVIRGPGAAVWGVNAVNGVINIISRHTRHQNGGEAVASLGTQGRAAGYVRYGGQLDEHTNWKMSVQSRHAEPSSAHLSGDENKDRLNNGVVDFRLDKDFGAGQDLTIWANASRSSLGDQLRLMPRFSSANAFLGMDNFSLKQTLSSQSLMGRYRWLSDRGIESSLQVALTGSSLDLTDFFKEQRTTYDLDYQARYAFSEHDLLWGLSHRTTSDSVTTNARLLSMANPDYTDRSTGAFIRDDWTLIRDRLVLGVGARWDHPMRGGNTFSPHATLMWTPSRADSIWLKYARAPRVPARAEHDVTIFASVLRPSAATMGLPVFLRTRPSSQTLKPEEMEGFELGYRKQLTSNFNTDVTVYRYRYTNLRSGVPTTQDFSALPLNIIQNVEPCNCMAAWVSGAELSADWLLSAAWRMQLSYAWTSLEIDRSSIASLSQAAEADERGGPRHFGSLRSQWNISPSQQFDAWIRGSAGFERRNTPYTELVRVPGYATLDLRYGHKLNKDVELALSGRNLLGPRRIEFVSDYVPSPQTAVGPSLLLSMRWKF